MKTNNYIALSLAAALLTAFPSCSKDDSSVTTSTETSYADPKVVEALKILQTPVKGWEMRVYPDRNMSYGGFTSFIKFEEDGSVQTMTEVLDAKVYQSLYSIDQSNGMTLNFNTYNPAIHAYSEPNSDNAAFAAAATNRGADGDNAFQFVSVAADKVVIRGVHTHNLVVLTPLSDDTDWSTLHDSYVKASSDLTYPELSVSVGGKELGTVNMATRHITGTVDGKEVSIPFRYTATGIELYEETAIGSAKVQTITFNGNTSNPSFSSTDGQLVLSPIAMTGSIEDLLSKNRFAFSSESIAGGRARKIYDTLAEFYAGDLKNRSGYTFIPSNFAFGYNASAGFALYADLYFVGGGQMIYTAMPFKMEKVSDSEFTFTAEPSKIDKSYGSNGYNELFLNSSNMFSTFVYSGIFANVGSVTRWGKSLISDANWNGRTFKVEIADPYKRTLTFTDKLDPTSVITLTKE